MLQRLATAAALCFSAAVLPLHAGAATLLFEETRDYGSGPGRIDPEGNAQLFDDFVQLKQTGADSRTVFRDTFDFTSLLPAGIGRFELELTFENAGPRSGPFFGTVALFEQWIVVLDGTPIPGQGLGTRRYQSVDTHIQDENSPQTLIFTPDIDGTGLTADSDAFAHTAGTGEFTFWLSDIAGSGPDTMDLYSATLRVYSGDVAPVPVPSAAWLMLTGLGALALRRRG